MEPSKATPETASESGHGSSEIYNSQSTPIKNSHSGHFDHSDINHQLLPKAVAERIKETKGALPVTANTLANYRNFQL